jgi:accessory colonization factor AcfC
VSKKAGLHVFSSGGVAPPVKKCAEDFEKKSGTEIARAGDSPRKS